MGELFLVVGAAIYVALGALHGIWALRDIATPRTFTPADDSVRKAMIGVPMALHTGTDMWRGWLGFNLSHSLGLIVFGGTLLAIGLFRMDLFVYREVQIAALTASGVYLVLSVKFWFSGPVIGTGIATLCFLAAAFLS